jgi:methyl-accepting chemotaxis protein
MTAGHAFTAGGTVRDGGRSRIATAVDPQLTTGGTARFEGLLTKYSTPAFTCRWSDRRGGMGGSCEGRPAQVRWTVGRRLTAIGFVAIVAATVVGLIGMIQAASSSRRAEDAFAISQALATTNDAQHTASVVLADASILMADLPADRRTAIVEQMTEHAGELADQVSWLQETDLGGEFRAAEEAFLPAAGPVLDDVDRLARSTGPVPQAEFDTVQQHWDALDEGSDAFKTLLAEASQRSVTETAAGNNRTRTILLAITLASAVVVAAMTWLVARLVTPPIGATKRLLERVAEGDFTGRVSVRTNDDLGDMAAALNATVERVGTAIRDIGRSVDVISASARDLTTVSQQVAEGAQRTSGEAGAASDGSRQIDDDVHAIAAGAEQMRTSIQEIARNAASASTVVATAVQAAEGATRTVAKLGSSSDQIGQVAKTIAAIAEQTNLLALNATIEAARAGEAGKGFAVVAGEVKDLASETAKATEDIAQQISTLQADSSDVASVISGITSTINEISAMQQHIAAAVEQQSASTNEIGGRVSRAAERAGDIAQRVEAVTRTSQEATESAARTERAASALSSTAGELQTVVSRFSLTSAS